MTSKKKSMPHSHNNKPTIKKVAVGSLNPAKIESVELAFTALFPNIQWQIEGVSVPSSVTDQPMSDKETIRGATNRAKRALKQLKADYGVGLEGGMQKIGKDWYECGWAVIIDSDGTKGCGSSFRLFVPPQIMKHIEEGKELGDAIDIVFHTKNAKHSNGFFGLMTDDQITRPLGYRDGIIAALSRFLHPEVFE